MAVQPRPTPRASGSYVGAIILIVIGLGALISNLGGSSFIGPLVPLGIGVAFLIAYATTRTYGFLVPAGVLSGVGAGVLISAMNGYGDNGTYAVLGLAIGFLMIYGVDMVVSREPARWWPLVPGAVMLLVAAAMATDQQGLLRQLGLWSPVILIVIGVWLLLARSRTAKS